MKESGAAGVAQQTILRTLHRRDLKPHRRPRRQALSDENMDARLDFCTEYRNTDWSQVVFSDETPFNSQKGFNSKDDVVWAHSAKEVRPVLLRKRAFNYPCWAAISAHGKTPLVLIEGTLNAEKYTQILEQTLLPCAQEWFGDEEWIFQQDGAAFHTARSVQSWLKANVPKFIPREKWPANSPDLNPIENLWGTVLDRAKKRKFTNQQEWQLALAGEWASIAVEDLQSLIGSMDQRIDACITASGGHFSI
jgi:hypothetical protein